VSGAREAGEDQNTGMMGWGAKTGGVLQKGPAMQKVEAHNTKSGGKKKKEQNLNCWGKIQGKGQEEKNMMGGGNRGESGMPGIFFMKVLIGGQNFYYDAAKGGGKML